MALMRTTLKGNLPCLGSASYEAGQGGKATGRRPGRRLPVGAVLVWWWELCGRNRVRDFQRRDADDREGGSRSEAAEARDAAVAIHLPVGPGDPQPVAVGRLGQAGDRGAAQCRREAFGVTEAEDPAGGRHEPVAVVAVGRGDADDRLHELDVAGGAEEPGAVAKGEHTAVGGDQPVAPAVGGDRHPDDRLVELDGARRPTEPGIAEGEDAAGGGDQVVAL